MPEPIADQPGVERPDGVMVMRDAPRRDSEIVLDARAFTDLPEGLTQLCSQSQRISKKIAAERRKALLELERGETEEQLAHLDREGERRFSSVFPEHDPSKTFQRALCSQIPSLRQLHWSPPCGQIAQAVFLSRTWEGVAGQLQLG